jgi:hypothetical protein
MPAIRTSLKFPSAQTLPVGNGIGTNIHTMFLLQPVHLDPRAYIGRHVSLCNLLIRINQRFILCTPYEGLGLRPRSLLGRRLLIRRLSELPAQCLRETNLHAIW